MTDLSRENEFYRRQCDEMGRRLIQLVEEQARVRRTAKRSAAVARVIRESYPLTKLDIPLNEIIRLFLQTVINAVGVDNAMILRYDRAKELLRVEHALGSAHGAEFISLPPQFLREFCPGNSRAGSDLLLNGLRTMAGVPYVLFAFHRESGLGLLLGNRIEDRNLHFPFDQKDREVVDGALHVFIHILEHKRAERAIRDSEERWKTILHSIQTGVMIIDAETHEIQYINDLAASLVGIPQEGALGAVCHTYVCPAERGKCPITDLGQIMDKSERVLMTVSGEQIPIIKSVVPLVLDGREVLLENFVDIRERKHMEKKLQLHVAQTERMNRLMRGRENRIIELKTVINDLLVRMGEGPRYPSVSAMDGASE